MRFRHSIDGFPHPGKNIIFILEQIKLLQPSCSGCASSFLFCAVNNGKKNVAERGSFSITADILSRFADPDAGSGAVLAPGSGMGMNVLC